jgi:3-phenylpropionate/cinnamic acid dioxygenase small subunit
VTAVEDHLAVLRVIAEYCRRCDDGRFGEFAQLFADDAQLVMRGQVAHGPDEITATIAALQTPERRGRHMVANTVVELAGDRASAESDFVFFRAGADGPLEAANSGRYLDEFARDDTEWRFTRREIALVEAVPAEEQEAETR